VAVWNVAFDWMLICCSAIFFLFALIVNYYNQTPTAKYKDLPGLLENAAKFV